VRARRWAFPERLAPLVEIEARSLEMLYDALSKLLPSVIRYVLSQQPA
jgi:hypothetical protein